MLLFRHQIKINNRGNGCESHSPDRTLGSFDVKLTDLIQKMKEVITLNMLTRSKEVVD